MANPPVPQGREAQIEYYSKYLAKLKGTYEGKQVDYRGLNAVDFYKKLCAAEPGMSPAALASAVLGIWAAGGLTSGLAAAGGTLGPFIQASNAAIPEGIQQATSPLQWLMSGQFWVRAGEVILGIVLMGVGLSKLAESNGAAKAVVNNVPGLKLASKVVK